MSHIKKSLTFSGGERHIELEASKFAGQLIHRIQSSDDLIDLILISEILGKKTCEISNLTIPYFPYARQDRQTAPLTAFSLKAICQVINSLGWGSVTVFDAHSDVTPALLENSKDVPQYGILLKFGDLEPDVVVAPDAGAVKKSQKAASLFGCPLVFATKERDVTTGHVKLTGLHGEVRDKHCLIVDDICDGGRTFIDLAKELRTRGAKSVDLYVTHGIFSQGFEVFDGIIDKIYTTNTFISGKNHPILTIREVV